MVRMELCCAAFQDLPNPLPLLLPMYAVRESAVSKKQRPRRNYRRRDAKVRATTNVRLRGIVLDHTWMLLTTPLPASSPWDQFSDYLQQSRGNTLPN